MTASRLDVPAEMAGEQLRRGRPLVARARGDSMWPAIRDGAEVTVRPTPDLRVGDVVLFERGGVLVLHRVVAARPGGLLVKGDALHAPDGVIARAEVLGRLDRRLVDPVLGRLSRPAGRARGLLARLKSRFFDHLRGRS